MALPPFGQGAPLSFGGQNVARLADLNNVTLAAGASVTGTPTAARTYILPLLSTVKPGDTIAVRNLGIAAITITADGTDAVNDAGAPGTFTIQAGQDIVLSAKVADGGTAGSWFTGTQIINSFVYCTQVTALTPTNGNPLIVNAIANSRGTAISYVVGTGIFTLAAGNTYRCTGGSGSTLFSGATGQSVIEWFNITGGAAFGGKARSQSPQFASDLALSSAFVTSIIQPTVATTIEFRANSLVAFTNFQDNSLLVEQI